MYIIRASITKDSPLFVRDNAGTDEHCLRLLCSLLCHTPNNKSTEQTIANKEEDEDQHRTSAQSHSEPASSPFPRSLPGSFARIFLS